jgi:hypothetical protein
LLTAWLGCSGTGTPRAHQFDTQIAGASVENQTPTHTDIGDTVLYGAKGAKAGFRESVVTDQEHHAQTGNEGPPGTF